MADKVLFQDITSMDRQKPCIPTGSIVLDSALHFRPFIRSRIHHISGDEGGGKTTLSLELAKNHILMRLLEGDHDGEKFVYFYDVERALDFSLVDGIVPLELQERIRLAKPLTAEDCMNSILKICTDNKKILCIVDSVAALSSECEINESVDKASVGGIAALMSKFCRKILNAVDVNENTVIFLNQLRSDINTQSKNRNKKVEPGGKALGFYSTQHLRFGTVYVADRFMTKDKERRCTGHKARVEIKRNKVGSEKSTVEVPLYYGRGIWKEREVLEQGYLLGILSRQGNKYFYGDLRLGASLDNSVKYLEKNPDVYNKIRRDLFESIPNVDACSPILRKFYGI